jgi:hypothetical protein
MKVKKLDIIMLIIVVVMLATLLYIAFKIQSEGTQCIANPEGYLLNSLSQANNANISCYCMADKPTLQPYIFTSNKK